MGDVYQFTAGSSIILHPQDMRFLRAVCVLLGCLTFLITKGDCQVKLHPGGKVRLCGKALTDTLREICVNGFYTNAKKSSEL